MNEIVKHELGIIQLGNILSDSKLFGCKPPEAIAKILLGRELGMGDVEALTKIHVIQGRPELSSNAIAAAIKRHPKYDYRVMENTDKKCSIDFFEILHDHSTRESERSPIGSSVYTIDDAKRAGLVSKAVWKQHPKAMLFARAISQGYRTHCPDVFSCTVYVEGEISGGDPSPERQDADVVDVEAKVKRPKQEPKSPPKRYGGVRKRPKPEPEAGKMTIGDIRAKIAKECPEITPDTILTREDFAVSEGPWVDLAAKDATGWQDAAAAKLREVGISSLNIVDQAFALLAHDLKKARPKEDGDDLAAKMAERRGQAKSLQKQLID